MSHQIEDNMIAWKGEQPWHGLGFEVPANATGADMLTVAKLDWRVQRRRIAMRNAAADRAVLLTDPLKSFRAIVRSDNDHVFQVASDRYHPVQNAEIVEFFREYCEAGHATMETIGGLRGGAVVWALARLNGGSTAVIDGVDELRGYLLLATSHDGSVRTIGQPTQVRVVCWNTLRAAFGDKSKGAFMMKHSRKWDASAKDEAKEVMGMAIKQVQATNDAAARLSKIRVTGSDRIEFLRNLLNVKDEPVPVEVDGIEPTSDEIEAVLSSISGEVSEKDINALGKMGQDILEAMYNSPGSRLSTADGTLWGVVNGVTFYADHQRSRTQDLRLHNAWFGSTDELKTKAMNLALQMAAQ